MKDEALKLAAPVQEPVAWMFDCGNGGRMYAEDLDASVGWLPLYTAPPAAPVQPVQEPEIVQRVKRYAGQTMRTARNPNITARECIELANWIVATPPAAQLAVPDALNPKDENPAYAAGWNDCRAEMLKGMKP